MTVNKAVALRIEKLLESKNMTLYRLEQESNIWHGTMNCIMADRNKTVTLTTIMQIAKGFDMTVLEFLNDDLFSIDNFDL